MASSNKTDPKNRAKIKALFVEMRQGGVPEAPEEADDELLKKKKGNIEPEMEINPLDSMFPDELKETLSQAPEKEKNNKKKLVNLLSKRLKS